jgi:cellulose synthase/poly-beta-1,6-N-acetylglucosamine synthase-like glycosyltransferase
MPVLFALVFWGSLGLLGWTYFGYPLLMFLRCQLRPQPIHKAPLTPALTLLIPAYNEADVIRAKLDNTLSLNYPEDRLQILVVDDGSQDGTAAIVREYADRGVMLIPQTTRGGKIGAVNEGFKHAVGEIVVLSDASPIYETDALRKLASSFADLEVGVVVGTLAVYDEASGVAQQVGLYWRYEAALRRWESLTGSTVAVHGNMFAVRRALYRPLPAHTVNDEFSIAMEVIRQGYRVIDEPEALSYDSASQNMRGEFNRRARINAGRYQALFSAGYLRAPSLDYGFRLFSHKLLRPLAPVFMVLMLVANPLALIWPGNRAAHLLRLGGWWGALLLLGQIGFYALAALGWQAERRGRRGGVFLSVPYFFVSTNLAALVGLWRWLRGSQRVTWQKRTT